MYDYDSDACSGWMRFGWNLATKSPGAGAVYPMDCSHTMSAGAERFRGQTISFHDPPPSRMRQTLVARLIEHASPWLEATFTGQGKVEYKIKIPSKETFGLFAAINGQKCGVPSISSARKIGEQLHGAFFVHRTVLADCQCPRCDRQCNIGIGYKRSGNVKVVKYAACKCFLGGKVRRAHPMAEKKLSNMDRNVLNVFSDSLEVALEVFLSEENWPSTLGCGLTRNQDVFARLGFANELSRLSAGNCVNYMLSAQCNAEFSPRFGLHADKELYQSIIGLMSWEAGSQTMIHVSPSVDGTAAANRMLVEEFTRSHGGKCIFNRENLYLVNQYDFSVTSTMCSYFFSRECTENLSLSLHWRWDKIVKPHLLEGIWYDACKTPQSLILPRGMRVIYDFSEFSACLKTTMLPVYIINAQEIDFVTMRDILEQVKRSQVSCHMSGLAASFMPSKNVRMKGRPFLFFAWWRCIKPEPLENNTSLPHLSTPILDTSVDELCMGLQMANLHPDCQEIADNAIIAWHENNWDGVEYTVSHEHFHERAAKLGNFQYKKLTDKTIALRISQNICYIKITMQGDENALYHISSGDWCGVCRSNRWAPIDKDLRDKEDWIVTEIPRARMSPACFVYTVPPAADYNKTGNCGTRLGFLCTLSTEGITTKISNEIARIKGTESILVPPNRETSPALAIALDCYHAAVGAPSVETFVRCAPNKTKELNMAFAENLTKALRLCEKAYKASLLDIFYALKAGEESTPKKTLSKKRKKLH